MATSFQLLQSGLKSVLRPRLPPQCPPDSTVAEEIDTLEFVIKPVVPGQVRTASPFLPLDGGGLVTKLCPTLVTLWAIACWALHPWDFPAKILEWVCHFLLYGGLPDPGIKPGSPALQVDSLLTEPPRKPSHSSILPKWILPPEIPS